MAYFDLKAYLIGLYGQDLSQKILHSFTQNKDIGVFVNSLKCDILNFEKELTKANIAFKQIDENFYKIAFLDKSTLTHLQIFSQGFFYVQNYSSYLCAKNLDPKSDQNVLDLCAAPGGKSINLANFMQNKGELACVEASKERFFTLKNNLVRYGVRAKAFHKDGKIIGRLCPLKFDKILLDAPCSSFAKFGLNLEKSPKELKNIALLQKKLLHSALKALKRGGELVYSTCTFLKEENEEVLENALNSEFEFEFLPLKLDNITSIEAFSTHKKLTNNARRIIADDFNDGFFIAKIKKL